MAVEKKSLISNRAAVKKAVLVSSATESTIEATPAVTGKFATAAVPMHGKFNPGHKIGKFNPGHKVGKFNPGTKVGKFNPGSKVGKFNPGSKVGKFNPGSKIGKFSAKV